MDWTIEYVYYDPKTNDIHITTGSPVTWSNYTDMLYYLNECEFLGAL